MLSVLLVGTALLGAQRADTVMPLQEKIAVVIDFVSMNKAAGLDSLGVVELAKAAVDSVGMHGLGVAVTHGREPLLHRHLRVSLELYSGGELRYEQDVVGPDGLVVPGCYTRLITKPRPTGTETEGILGLFIQGLRCLTRMESGFG